MDSLIPVSMGLWAVWTWSQDREQERQKERARLAALYVNPFLSACEDLQSRIYHEFKACLALPPLSDSEAIQQSIEALRSAEGGGDLPGRARLVQTQHHLVDLLSYLEGKEGYRLFPGERKKCSGLPRRSTPANTTRGPVPGVVPIAQASGPG